MNDTRTWWLENHLCRNCGGRILRCVSGNGVTPGGNPVYKCADCGAEGAQMSPRGLCWCGFEHKGQKMRPYLCVPFSILTSGKYTTETTKKLLSAFRACGCEPGRTEVGIMLRKGFEEALL